VNFTKC